MLLAPACSTSGDNDRLTIFAAASLTEVFTNLEPDARISFAGSDQLTTQLREGAGVDVYASADPRLGHELFEEGVVDRPRVFATNRLVLITPADDPARIQTVDDLAAPGIKIILGAEGVPIGDYTRKLLRAMGRSDIVSRAASHEQDVKEIVGKIVLGEADAGFVYATDVAPVKDDVRSLELDPTGQPSIRYVVAIVSDSSSAEEAEAFVTRLLSAPGRQALRSAGFGLP